jgi:hypothetical protein
MSLTSLVGKRGLMVALTCSVLAFATSASAECAWVLWKELMGKDGGGWNTYWGIEAAHKTKEECEKNRAGRSAEASREANRETRKALKIGYENYICLPDTVDPRGAKGR